MMCFLANIELIMFKDALKLFIGTPVLMKNREQFNRREYKPKEYVEAEELQC